MLPTCLQRLLVKEWNKDGRTRDVEDVLRAAANEPDSDDLVRKAVYRIVTTSSSVQAVKGIFSAGAVKTVRYSLAKLAKMFKSMRTKS